MLDRILPTQKVRIDTMSTIEWCTSDLPVASQYEAWQDALSASHLEWELSTVTTQSFNAQINSRNFRDLRIIECRCDPCFGTRGRPQIKSDSKSYFGILFNLSGREAVFQGGDSAILEPGDFVMWDSENDMAFSVLSPLHKLTLLVPKDKMQSLLGNPEHYVGKIIRNSTGVKDIAAESLRCLAKDFANIDEDDAYKIIDPLLSLLTATLVSRHEIDGISDGYRDSYKNFCTYIARNIGDSTLSPVSVAGAHNVSVRYLHRVYATHGQSFAKSLREDRLTRCYNDLKRNDMQTITEVAFRWGFNDMAHFSRIFKRQYGCVPSKIHLR